MVERWEGSRATMLTRRILERDEYQCQLRLDGCTHRATTADHIVPKSKGGPMWSESNLQAACRPCNNHKYVGLDEGPPVQLPDWLG